MVIDLRDRDEADRLDRCLDALSPGGGGAMVCDPAQMPLLRLMKTAASREQSLAPAARQRIWQHVAAAADLAGMPVPRASEPSASLANLPRPVGIRTDAPKRERRPPRWRPALELVVIALLLIALIGNIWTPRQRPPTLPALLPLPQATPTAQPASLYTLDLLLRVTPPAGQAITPSLLKSESHVLKRRAQALGIPAVDVMVVGGDEIRVQLKSVILPPAFAEAVLTETGLFEIIDTQGMNLGTGTVVETSLGGATSPATPGPVYSTLASSQDVVGAKPLSGATGPNAVEVTLSAAAGEKMARFFAAHAGRSNRGVTFAFVLDKRVLKTEYVLGVQPAGQMIVPVQPPVSGATSPLPLLPLGTQLVPQNALVAMLTSGPLPAPLTVVSASTAAPATPAATPAATPTTQSTATPTAPYDMELVLRVTPPSGQALTQDLAEAEIKVLRQRAQALGLKEVLAELIDGEIHVVLTQVDLPESFVEGVLTQTGLFEIIDPDGKYLAAGTLVRTTLSPPAGAAASGPVFTTIVSSQGIETALGTTASPGNQPLVTISLIEAAANQMAQYLRAHVGPNGQVAITFVLDKHVLVTKVSSPKGALNLTLAVTPPVRGLANPTPTPQPGGLLIPQNGLVAILDSGPLPAPVALVRETGFQPPTARPATPAAPAAPAPTNPYSMDLVLRVTPPPGQTVTPSLLDAARKVLTARANALGLTEVTATDAGADTILLQLRDVDLPPAFVERVLSQVGQFEIIDPKDNFLWSGMAVRTTLGPPAATPGPGVYTTLASSKDVVQTIIPTSSNPSAFGVVIELSDAAGATVKQYVAAQHGAYLTYVLDKRVLLTQLIPIFQGNDLVIVVLPPVTGLGTPIPTTPPGTTIPPQNALVAMLTSGALPAPVTVVSSTAGATPTVSPATPTAVATVAATLTSQSSAAPASPYNMELVLRVVPTAGQVLTPSLEQAEVQVLMKRAQVLGIPVSSAGPVHSEVHLLLTGVNYPPAFVEQVFTQVGLLEIIDPQGKNLAPGTVVRTTLGASAIAEAAGPVYTTIVSSKDLASAFPTNGATGQPAVGFTLNSTGAAHMEQFSRTHLGQPVAIVLDKRVLYSPTIQGVISNAGIVEAVNLPAVGLVPATAVLPPNPNWPAQNALVAILTSGPLPAPVIVASTTVVPADVPLPGAPTNIRPTGLATMTVAQLATVAALQTQVARVALVAQQATENAVAGGSALATAQVPIGSSALNPNAVQITIHVDAEGLVAQDPGALSAALKMLQNQLKGYAPPCRIGIIFTTGAGDIGPGNDLAKVINALLKSNFPQLIDDKTAFQHYAQPSLSPGTVQIELYFFQGCPARATGSPPAATPGATPSP